jgi:hypothetical protein
MEWIAENWFLILIFLLFVGMHMFGHGHGGHGGHGGHSHGSAGDQDQTEYDKNNHQHH